MALANELAERISAFTYADLGPEAVHWGKVAIADTIAVTLAGSPEPCVDLLERTLAIESTAGPCLVLGRGRRAGPLEAALVNGTAAHALDFDDTNKSMGGHPSAPVLPVLLALADRSEANGRDLLAAFAAGFETECKLARAVNFHHYEKGWHPTATLGIFGAAAAAGRLLGLSVDELSTALSLAVSLASSVKANLGSMTKPLHVGHAARNGLFAALLAREGYTARDWAFEHRQGFFEVFNGPGTYDVAKIFESWADPLELEWPAIGIKQYPCCASTHACADGLFALIARERLGPDDVASIRAVVHPRRYVHVNRPDPTSPLDAKFSLRYCVARALLDGALKLEHFQGDAHNEAVVRAVMERVETGEFAPDAPEIANHLAAVVSVVTADGRTLVEKVDQAVGRGPEKPIPEAGFKAKFEECCSIVLGTEAVARLYELCRNLERLDRAAALSDAMAAAPAVPSRAIA